MVSELGIAEELIRRGKENPQREATLAFLNKLQQVKPLGKVYYPGCGVDFTLDQIFEPETITYLDRYSYREDVKQGDYGKSELPDEQFDGIYIKDIHAKPNAFKDILRVLKKDGVLIVSPFECGAEHWEVLNAEKIGKLPQLQEVSMVEDDQSGIKTFRKAA